MRCVSNGLAIVLVILVALIPMRFPAAGSAAASPEWKWDAEGRVHDATGQYRSMTEEEVCREFGWCREIVRPASLATLGSEGVAGDGGGCK